MLAERYSMKKVPKLWASGGDWLLHHGTSHVLYKVLWQNIAWYRCCSSPLLQPRIGCLWILAFPKAKTTFERNFQAIDKITENAKMLWQSQKRTSQTILKNVTGSGITVRSPEGTTLKGAEVKLYYVCYLCFNNKWVDTFWTDLIDTAVCKHFCNFFLQVHICKWC